MKIIGAFAMFAVLLLAAAVSAEGTGSEKILPVKAGEIKKQTAGVTNKTYEEKMKQYETMKKQQEEMKKKQEEERKRQEAQVLARRQTYVNCRLDFAISFLQQAISSIPGAGQALSPYAQKLQDDKTQIASAASSGSTGAFQTAVSQAQKDMQDANSAIAKQKGTLNRTNATKETMASLKANYEQLRQQLSGCENSAVMAIGSQKLGNYEKSINEWNAHAQNMTQKGLDATGVKNVIASAQPTVDSLKNAIASGNASTVKTALQSNCLGNGCVKGENYHGYAKAQIARVQAVLDKAKAAPGGSSSSALSQAQAKIDDANTILSQVGTAVYQEGQVQQIKTDMEGAANLIKEFAQPAKKPTPEAGQAQ